MKRRKLRSTGRLWLVVGAPLTTKELAQPHRATREQRMSAERRAPNRLDLNETFFPKRKPYEFLTHTHMQIPARTQILDNTHEVSGVTTAIK